MENNPTNGNKLSGSTTPCSYYDKSSYFTNTNLLALLTKISNGYLKKSQTDTLRLIFFVFNFISWNNLLDIRRTFKFTKIFYLKIKYATPKKESPHEINRKWLFPETHLVFGLRGSNMHEITFIPVGIYLLKVNNRNTRIKCEI